MSSLPLTVITVFHTIHFKHINNGLFTQHTRLYVVGACTHVDKGVDKGKKV